MKIATDDKAGQPDQKDPLRPARRGDVSAMHRVRMAVRENRLNSLVLTEADYLEAIEGPGCCGWVAEADGQIVGFACGSAESGNIWALFVDPEHEGRGFGRRLHDALVARLWSDGAKRLWLTTAPGTRAEGFYRKAGWQCRGSARNGELRFELSGKPSGAFSPAKENE
ncbi:MAG: GNAT family N-acetyltransferase [Pyrinomonadaceae bacterium]